MYLYVHQCVPVCKHPGSSVNKNLDMLFTFIITGALDVKIIKWLTLGFIVLRLLQRATGYTMNLYRPCLVHSIVYNYCSNNILLHPAAGITQFWKYSYDNNIYTGVILRSCSS